jgi:uncharacterized protein YyaL (SSP411 family)
MCCLQHHLAADADAKRAAEFARDKLWDEGRRRLRRSYRTGPSDVDGFADDYACLISGLLDLHAASGDHCWLRFALQLQSVLDELFWDEKAGGLFLYMAQLRCTMCASAGAAQT